jgi:hypothetical protein
VAVVVAVDVAVLVGVDVGVEVREAVGVGVAVGVGEGVAVVVAVGDGVTVGVGGNDPFAEPLRWTLIDALPAVASLLIVILPEKPCPLLVGANSTAIVDTACG